MLSPEEPETPPPHIPLLEGLRERQITSSASDLSYYVLEAGEPPKPLIILLHGFPELAYSWQKIMPALAAIGYYVVAFDQRGYGRTTGWDTSAYADVDLRTFQQTNLLRDVIVLVQRLGYNEVECVIGHDFGGAVASLCGLARPDMFRRVVLIGYPFQGAPKLPFNKGTDQVEEQEADPDIHQQLASLSRPRKHYQWHYASASANEELFSCKGPYAFLSGYFHLKSADAPNDPHPLKGATAEELSKLPDYYIMPLELGMSATVTRLMTDEELHKAGKCEWLTESELEVYDKEFSRNGFQGGLNWYRVATTPALMRDLDIFAGKKIEVPLLYIAGTKDWLPYQIPGSLERMNEASSIFEGEKWIEGAGHWVQQEQPERVVQELESFLRKGQPENAGLQQDTTKRERRHSRIGDSDGDSDRPSKPEKKPKLQLL